MSKHKRKRKPKAIHITGRRWFQRTYGNTYHSASIFIDGELVHTLPIQYGYGDQYLYNAQDWLYQNGYLRDLEISAHKTYEPLSIYCRRKNIVFTYVACDVAREKDL